jgi:hypothetical protein
MAMRANGGLGPRVASVRVPQAGFLRSLGFASADGLGRGTDLPSADTFSLVLGNVWWGTPGAARVCRLIGLDS